MADPTPEGGEPHWLLRPPAPGQVHVHLAVGEGAELTPELQARLERLSAALHGQDVQGYAASGEVATCFPQCGSLDQCSGTFACNLNNCILTSMPCAVRFQCKIG